MTKWETTIEKLLLQCEATSKQAIKLNYDKSCADLKEALKHAIDFLIYAITENAEGRIGLRSDAYGFLEGETVYTKGAWPKTCPNTYHLVDKYCKEIRHHELNKDAYEYQFLSQEEKNANATSPMELAIAMTSTDAIVEIPCRDGGTFLLDKENKLKGVQDTPNGEIKWYKTALDFSKGIAFTVLSIIKCLWTKVWAKIKELYYKVKEFFFPSDELQTI